MASAITKIYHDDVSAILTDILGTVSAETGKQYHIRVRSGKLYGSADGGVPGAV